jgi:hypothetical protein
MDIRLGAEGFVELIATVLVAAISYQLALSTARRPGRIYLNAILWISDGINGTGHNRYFICHGKFKMGLHSVGVKCQSTGTAGRIEKSQVAVFLSLAGPVVKEASMSMLSILTAVNVAPRYRPSLYCQS